MSGFTDAFSNDLLPPSDLGLLRVVLSGTTQAEWPGNYSGAGVPLPKILEVTCDPGSTLKLPPADQVSPGSPVLIRNSGANTLAVQNYAGAGLVSIATGIAQFLYVIDNSTPAGTWGQITYGAGGSSVASGALAGYGTKATGSTLSVASPVYSVPVNTSLTTAMRGQTIEFTGGAASLMLGLASEYGNDFYCMVKNSGTGAVSIVPSGAELADVTALQPTESFTLICTGTEWITVGYGRSLLYQTSAISLDVTAGGTFTLSAAQASKKLITFIGSPAADVTVIVPSALSVYYVANSLTAAHTVFFKTSTGSPMAIHQNIRAILVCDGLEVTEAQSQVVVNTQSIPDGTVSNPALNFYSDTGTGFYKFGAHGFGISVSGVSQLEAGPTGVNFPVGVSIAGIPMSPSGVNGGSTTTTSAVDVTLTATSTRLQVVNMTASGMSVILPDATTLSLGGALFVIAATGYPLTIKDGAGTVLQAVGSGQKVMLFLSDTSTAAGVWAAGVFPYYGNQIAPTTSNILTSVACSQTCVTALSSTVAVVVSSEGTPVLGARVLSIQGGVVVVGPGTNFSVAAYPNTPMLTALSATKALCVYTEAAIALQAVVLDVSGMTVIPGSPQAVAASAHYAGDLVMLTSTKALCTFSPASGTAKAVVLDVSGTTITPGSITPFGSAIGTSVRSCALSPSKALCVYYDQTNALNKGIVLDISGSSVIPGLPITLAGISNQAYAVAALSATQAMLVYGTVTTLNPGAKILDVSGTTITPGASTNLSSMACAVYSVTTLSPTRVLMQTYTNAAVYGRYAQVIDVIGTSVLGGQPLQVTPLTGSDVTVSALSATKAITVYPGASSYLNANILDIGVSI